MSRRVAIASTVAGALRKIRNHIWNLYDGPMLLMWGSRPRAYGPYGHVVHERVREHMLLMWGGLRNPPC
eukprot:10267252-Alexandrium_andersonii.AAC.1